MRIPRLTSRIGRRLLINYRTDPEITARLVPAPMRPQVVNGWAVSGICLIRLGQTRPLFMPALLGPGSENAAHRIAVEWDSPDGVAYGVYIPRRDTGSRLNALAGGRVFPGRHHLSRFDVHETPAELRIEFTGPADAMSVGVHVRLAGSASSPGGAVSRSGASSSGGAGSPGRSAVAGVLRQGAGTLTGEDTLPSEGALSSEGALPGAGAPRGADGLPGSRLFGDIVEASEFFRRGSAGYSVTPDPGRLDGVELYAPAWQAVSPGMSQPIAAVELVSVRSTFFDDPDRFPPGSAVLDCGLLMRDLAAVWKPLPPMAVRAAGGLATFAGR